MFGEARRLGYGRYFLNSPRAIEDDHAPFLNLGEPAVDIIDLNYGPFNLYWHSRYEAMATLAIRCAPGTAPIVCAGKGSQRREPNGVAG